MEEKVSTKERILLESLRLFSEKGYDGVSMREIAAAVGIKGASIYTHFAGKQDILQAIFAKMEEQYRAAAVGSNIPAANSNVAAIYQKVDEKQLLQMVKELFAFFVEDEFTVMFRKLLKTEQHRTAIAGETMKAFYLDAPFQYQTELFREMQKQGSFQGFDPEAMALHFYSPIFYLFHAYDLGKSGGECMELLKKHVHWFWQLYENKRYT